MNEPTPGPWEWDGKFTVSIPHKDGQTAFRTQPEDACLIAAAPDMLEALQEITRIRLDTSGGSLRARADQIWEKASAAIAKAEGRP